MENTMKREMSPQDTEKECSPNVLFTWVPNVRRMFFSIGCRMG